jgi:glycosyltransferase involved in cell wall biosynthesis
LKILYFTNTFSHYRKPIWKKLLELEKHEIFFHFSFESFSGIKNSNWESKYFFEIKNLKIFDLIFWQRGVLRKVVFDDYDVLLLLGEMTILSSWLAAFIARIRNKKIIFWGHGIYGNESIIKKKIRIWFLRLSHFHFLYGNHAKEILIKNGFKKDSLVVIYNSLDVETQSKYYLKDDECKILNNLKTDKYLLFSGRLTKIKKLDLLFDAIEFLNKDQDYISLLIIGDGPEKNRLENKYSSLISRNIIKFVGDVYEESKLSLYFKKAHLFVSPGNIGLASMHSLIYGTPVCAHYNMNFQMPEAECLDNKNSVLFERDNVNSLIEKIIQGIKLKDNPETEIHCRQTILNNYTPSNQISIIENFLNSI